MTGPMAVRKKPKDLSPENGSKRRFFLRKLFLSTAAAGLTFFVSHKFMSEHPELLEPMHAAPTDFKTQFEINAHEVSYFAGSDTEACVGRAFVDYVLPLAEKMRNSLPLRDQINRLREGIASREAEIAAERKKIQEEYKTTEGLEVVNIEDISSNVIDILKQDIETIRKELEPLEKKQKDIVFDQIDKFDALVLFLHQEGMLEYLPRDYLNLAYSMLTYRREITGNIESEATRAIYLSTDLMQSLGNPWIQTETTYLSLISENKRARDIVANWTEPKTDEDFEKAKMLVQELAGIILTAQFQGSEKATPRVVFFDEENQNLLAAYNPEDNAVGFNINKKSNMWKDGNLVLASIVHEGTHGLLESFGALATRTIGTDKELLESSSLVSGSIANYIPAKADKLSYYSHPHERFARRAERVLRDFLDNPELAALALNKEYNASIEASFSRFAYQKSLHSRDKVTCDNFNFGIFDQPNLFTRLQSRDKLYNPHHFVP